MAIYDKPVRLLIREMAAELAPEKDRVFSKEDALAWFSRKFPKIKEGTISAHLIRFSTNAPSRLHYNPRSPGGHPNSSTCGRVKLLHPEHV
ncbi:MAG: DUF7669 domain-containing protein [Betaproteobacteria bacterium]